MIGLHQVSSARVMNAQRQDHRRGLRALMAHFKADAYLQRVSVCAMHGKAPTLVAPPKVVCAMARPSGAWCEAAEPGQGQHEKTGSQRDGRPKNYLPGTASEAKLSGATVRACGHAGRPDSGLWRSTGDGRQRVFFIAAGSWPWRCKAGASELSLWASPRADAAGQMQPPFSSPPHRR
jgi:hypothetical protein